MQGIKQSIEKIQTGWESEADWARVEEALTAAANDVGEWAALVTQLSVDGFNLGGISTPADLAACISESLPASTQSPSQQWLRSLAGGAAIPAEGGEGIDACLGKLLSGWGDDRDLLQLVDEVERAAASPFAWVGLKVGLAEERALLDDRGALRSPEVFAAFLAERLADEGGLDPEQLERLDGLAAGARAPDVGTTMDLAKALSNVATGWASDSDFQALGDLVLASFGDVHAWAELRTVITRGGFRRVFSDTILTRKSVAEWLAKELEGNEDMIDLRSRLLAAQAVSTPPSEPPMAPRAPER